MERPRNYDATQVYGEYEPLPAGAYECVIKKVEETRSKKGKEMLNIYLDISRGEYRNFYSDSYRNDNRADKKWPCIVYQLTEDNNGDCNPGLKSFINNVAASNRGFDESRIWGPQFAEAFKGLSIGGVFRREQYENRDRKLRWSTKCFKFCPVQEVDSIDAPDDKPLDDYKPSYSGNAPAFNDYSSSDDELPF